MPYSVVAYRLRLLIGVLLTMPALLASQDKKGARAVCILSSIPEKQHHQSEHVQGISKTWYRVLWQHVTLTNCFELTF